MGDDDFFSSCTKIALQPGISWSEQQRGTHAVGTALREETALVVHGSEHYLSAHHFLTCSCAPIMGADGKVLGSLDLTFNRQFMSANRRAQFQLGMNMAQLSYRAARCIALRPRMEGDPPIFNNTSK